MFLSARNCRQDNVPKTPITKSNRAAPEPFPAPNNVIHRLPIGCFNIKGSNIRSTRKPPHRYPKGIVKYCKVFLAEYTRPCIWAGIFVRKSTSILAPITGMKIHPRNAPIHHTGALLPKARIKFSVLMEKSRLLHIKIKFDFIESAKSFQTNSIRSVQFRPVQTLHGAAPMQSIISVLLNNIIFFLSQIHLKVIICIIL